MDHANQIVSHDQNDRFLKRLNLPFLPFVFAKIGKDIPVCYSNLRLRVVYHQLVANDAASAVVNHESQGNMGNKTKTTHQT